MRMYINIHFQQSNGIIETINFKTITLFALRNTVYLIPSDYIARTFCSGFHSRLAMKSIKFGNDNNKLIYYNNVFEYAITSLFGKLTKDHFGNPIFLTLHSNELKNTQTQTQ